MPTITSRRAWLALISMLPALLVVGLDITTLSVALPTLAVDLNASTSQLQWFVIAYTLTYAAAMIPSGTLADRYGRKRVFLLSMAVFTLGSLGCALSQSSAQLIAARALLGVGAAGVVTIPLALVNVLFEPHVRPKAMTTMLLVNMVGFPLGPIVGGWMLGHVAWGWIFMINVPIAVVAIIGVALVVPENRAAKAPRWDVPGLVGLSAALVGLCYGITQGASDGWSDISAWLPTSLGAVLTVAFVVVELRATSPLVPMSLFRKPRFVTGAAAASLLSFATAGILFAVPQYTQAVLGADTEPSGLYLTAFAGGMLVASPLASKVLRVLGRVATVALGISLAAVSLWMASATTIGSGGAWLVAWALVIGAGFGFGLPTSMDLAIGCLDPEASGVGSAVLQALRQVFTTVGAAVLGGLLGSGYRAGLPADLPGTPQVQDVIRKGVEQGLAVAGQLHSSVLLDQVRAAFVNGMVRLTTVTAVLASAAALALVVGVLVRVTHHRGTRRAARAAREREMAGV